MLNILKEGGNLRRNFYPQRGSSLDYLATKTASNSCSILEEALAYLECTVQSRLASGDRTLIYATIDRGELIENKGITAIQHRKSGSQY